MEYEEFAKSADDINRMIKRFRELEEDNRQLKSMQSWFRKIITQKNEKITVLEGRKKPEPVKHTTYDEVAEKWATKQNQALLHPGDENES